MKPMESNSGLVDEGMVDEALDNFLNLVMLLQVGPPLERDLSISMDCPHDCPH